jgi:CBS domain containing-hemolysin-like protein
MEKLKEIWTKIIRELAEWLGPKLDRYRKTSNFAPRHPKEELSLQNTPKTELPPEVFTPESLADLFWLLKKTPKSVLSSEERELIITAMTFNERKVKEVMLPKNKITFVHENDFLGPLTLDKLYKSGMSHFPVKDGKGEIIGFLHTESLNSLRIKETDRAKKYLDPQMYYMREDYTLDQAMAAFLRTNCYFFLVINKHGEITGMMSFEELLKLLLGKLPVDTFTEDKSRSAVANR